MGKALWFVFWIFAGIVILTISSINDTLVCSKLSGFCTMQSKIAILNLNINDDKFSPEEIKTCRCDKIAQPSRSGKKYYYILKLTKNDGADYNLGSYNNYRMCKDNLAQINDFIKGKTNTVRYNSGTGFANITGYILSFIMFIIGIIILTSKEEVVEDDFDNED